MSPWYIQGCLSIFLFHCRGELSASIPSLGDYELQVSIIEALFRFTNKRDRKQLAQAWFKSRSQSEAFSAIKDSEFETVSGVY